MNPTDFPISYDARMNRLQQILDKIEKNKCVEHLGTEIEYCSLYNTKHCRRSCNYALDMIKWDNKRGDNNGDN